MLAAPGELGAADERKTNNEIKIMKKISESVRDAKRAAVKAIKRAIDAMKPAYPARAMAAAACAMVLAIGASQARAEGDNQSFGVTNSLVTAVDMRTYPTNAVATTNFTGGPINVQNYKSGGFYFKGDVVTAGTATVTLVRSPFKVASNSLTNWESVASLTITVPMPATGTFMYMTNLDGWFLDSANNVGINRLTNAVGNITNLEVGITKKILPPGNK